MRVLICLLVFSFITLSASAQYQQPVNDPLYALFLGTLYDNNSLTISAKDYDASKEEFVLLLDTRPVSEFTVSHIAGAMQTGFEDFDFAMMDGIATDAKILIYCSVGGRSGIIGGQLRNMGYTNIYNLYGGMFEWINQEYPVVKPNGIETDEVHPFDENWGRWLQRGVKTYE